MRFVVVSKNTDENLRVFGTFSDRAKAELLAEGINRQVEKREDEEFEAWRHDDGSMAPAGYGRCGVLIIHKWSVHRALRFSLGEYDS